MYSITVDLERKLLFVIAKDFWPHPTTWSGTIAT
ncbi:hypothetical protein HNQ99_001016 [Rhizorhapis suberifaciens]|uniref:Uncharacterized protein n=1 Tax=Rhizorhapis suberifaciens TaxID=13656 RepID=A0A840HS32_9SPHN|nr:hypothetical protein [Rhizorhapis suberifaciens]